VRSIPSISSQVDKGNCIGYDFNREFNKEWLSVNKKKIIKINDYFE
jgi:hypothetical protein